LCNKNSTHAGKKRLWPSHGRIEANMSSSMEATFFKGADGAFMNANAFRHSSFLSLTTILILNFGAMDPLDDVSLSTLAPKKVLRKHKKQVAENKKKELEERRKAAEKEKWLKRINEGVLSDEGALSDEDPNQVRMRNKRLKVMMPKLMMPHVIDQQKQ